MPPLQAQLDAELPLLLNMWSLFALARVVVLHHVGPFLTIVGFVVVVGEHVCPWGPAARGHAIEGIYTRREAKGCKEVCVPQSH
jgi:hypothetical protein